MGQLKMDDRKMRDQQNAGQKMQRWKMQGRITRDQVRCVS